MESVEAKTKDIMPVAFEFKCIPFEGLKERPFKLRMSIITGDRPTLVLRIVYLIRRGFSENDRRSGDHCR